MTQDPLFLVSINLFAAVLTRCLKPNLFSALLLAVVMIASTAYLGTQHGDEIMITIYKGHELLMNSTGRAVVWPPEKHRTYPDLELLDQDGKLRRLSEFKGKVILIEPVGMSCPACIAFSGGQQYGPFQGAHPQANLDSIEEYLRQFGRIEMDDPQLVFVQLLLFNSQMQAPTADEVTAWVKHFKLRRSENLFVLGGTPSLASAESRSVVPGFQLIDKNFILRVDSTGEQPADDLYRELLPRIRQLIDE